MVNPSKEILDWAQEGRLAARDVRKALEAGGALPSAADWRWFLDCLLLFTGVVLLAAGVVFFLAYNWRDLGRFAKFGLVELPLLATLAALWRLGLDRPAGKAALLLAALLAGALLALIGQTYQTGADTFELFAAWAVAVLPWVILGRFAALWVLWLALVNLAVSLYFQAFHGVLGIAFGPERQMWALFAINGMALVAWEITEGLHSRWAPQLIATAVAAIVTALAVVAIFDPRSTAAVNAAIWFAWVGATYAVYRRFLKDLYMLGLGALSVIVVGATFVGKLIEFRHSASFLFMGLLVIGLSAAAGYWLRRIGAEEHG
ncbi:MAG: DUF2157 domain-containing protein [Betaproteobacteria bacterium]|nr:MAG: DUF2157 domain-containing protein [Betaproteobacteria bacterium]